MKTRIRRLKEQTIVRLAARRRPHALAGVVAGTVTFTKTGGRGVLIPGGYILTAAHCIGWDAKGGMTLSPDDYREQIHTADGQKLHVSVMAIEPVLDVALLGAVDDQRGPEQAITFRRFCARTEPIPLFRSTLKPRDYISRIANALAVLIYNKDKRWVPGDAVIFRNGDPTVYIPTETLIEGGASGGPIVTPAGELVAVVSHAAMCAADGIGASDCTGVRPLQALPTYLAGRISAAVGQSPPKKWGRPKKTDK